MFAEFLNIVLHDIRENPVTNGGDNTRCIMWDNLSVHKNPYVTTTIQDQMTPNHLFSINFPPYCPKMAPMEYIFCEIANQLV